MTDAGIGLVAAALVAVALWVAADGLVRLNTWYLASDQFAFLTFSRDLREGTVFHEDPSWRLIAPKSRLTFDALAQTYFWRDGKLFSRYPPGFPALLAVDDDDAEPGRAGITRACAIRPHLDRIANGRPGCLGCGRSGRWRSRRRSSQHG